ncbi:hypothetical protein KCU95_g2305, partial [Aureobasidium melanogenum]
MAPPSRRQIADAVDRLQREHLPKDDKSVRLLCRAAKSTELCTFLEDLCPELRPEYYADLAHENPGVEAIRQILWDLERMPNHRLGCKVKKKSLRPGFSQITWQRQGGYLEDCDEFSSQADEEVYRALAVLDNAADPRTGTLVPPKRQPSKVNPEHRVMVKGVLMFATNLQIGNLQSLRDAQTDATRREMLQPPIDAMEGFCDRFRGLTTQDVSQAVSDSRKRRYDSDDDFAPENKHLKITNEDGDHEVEEDQDHGVEEDAYHEVDDDEDEDYEIPGSEDEDE